MVVAVTLSLELVTDECKKKTLPHRIECLTRCDKNSPTYIEIDDLPILYHRFPRVCVPGTCDIVLCFFYFK